MMRETQVLAGLTVAIIVSAVDGLSSGTLMGKEGDSLTMWCTADHQVDNCLWIAPTEENCLLLHDDFGGQKNCLQGAVARFTSGSDYKNCSLTLSRLSLSHNGQWKCHLSWLGNVQDQTKATVGVLVAKPANVDFLDVYGTVVGREGEVEDFTCTAKHGRPKGVFVWELIDDTDLSNSEDLAPQTPPSYEEDAQQLFTATQTISYLPKIHHDGMNLRCTYLQFDVTGKPLFEANSDCQEEIQISIHYLEKAEGKPPIDFPTVSYGNDYMIAVDFGAKPKPNPENVEWIIRTPIVEKRISLLETTFDDKYVVHPLEDLTEGKNKHLAKLTILGIQVEDTAYEYALLVTSADISAEGKGMPMTEEYRFKLPTPGQRPNYNDVDEVDIQEEGTSIVIIVVILVIVVGLIAGVTTGMICYGKKNMIWCWAPEPSKTPTRADPESISAPLKQDSGITDKFKRPT